MDTHYNPEEWYTTLPLLPGFRKQQIGKQPDRRMGRRTSRHREKSYQTALANGHPMRT